MDSFWKWFIKGSRKGPRGLWNIVNWFLLVHLTIAAITTFLIKSDAVSFAQKALFPASSILVGLSMSWTTRASTVLQTRELREKIFTEKRPAEDYVYGFQLAILIVVIMLAYVAVMAGGGLKLSLLGKEWDDYASAFWMYFLFSLALRECWGVINATNMLSMLEYLRTR